MISIQRPLLKQEAVNFAVTINNANEPVPLNSQMQLTAMVDSFMICNPVANANSIFIGFNSNVTTANGMEIVTGTSVNFFIQHDGRQLYEIQGLVADIAVALTCRQMQLDAIPFVCWDMSQVYIVATAATTIACIAFKAVYI